MTTDECEDEQGREATVASHGKLFWKTKKKWKNLVSNGKMTEKGRK